MRRRRGRAGQAITLLALIGLVAGVLTTPEAQGQRGARVGQSAPEITGGPWLNSEPLTLAGLRGRVVFIEFWTYG